MHLINQDLRPVRGPIRLSQVVLSPSLCVRYRWYPPIKFLAEWIMALLLLIPVGLLIGALAVLVKITSPGRAFYRQKRVGLNGRIFTMIKIRSMIENSEAKTGAVWSQPGDPRVTKIGRILRDTHMDELPQLWNVLRGEMSLIGPRPERPEIVSRLEASIPNYRDRMMVRPGLTGLAQVQLPPDSDDTSVKRKLAYDRYYVEQMSPWLDTRIAVSTFFYFSSAAFNALCHLFVRSYGKDIEENFLDPDLVDAGQSQPATVAG
jgi:lipopolysaccharide/colanic/teichoic acid biosynthesis glycosyltransferase